jgi:hypothetical protein
MYRNAAPIVRLKWKKHGNPGIPVVGILLQIQLDETMFGSSAVGFTFQMQLYLLWEPNIQDSAKAHENGITCILPRYVKNRRFGLTER